MFSPSRKSHPLITHLNSSLIDLPAPPNLSLMWNFGSLLGLCLGMQVITGLLLAMHYSPHTDLAFMSIIHITRDVNLGWLLRNLHANGASLFFLCMYLHMSRGMYFGSYKMSETWTLGVIIFMLTMATAFMGYLLPWGQMSFWGATVITNLFSAFPYFGGALVEWIWGGFGVNNATLTRFFTLHFILPFVIMVFALLHLIFLHLSGSSNPLGTNSNASKIPFHIHYSSKDLMGFMILGVMMSLLGFFYPNLLGDPENFIPANPLVTPTHIKPEWYFLWAYAILRSIPNKLGGVIAMFSAILILFTPAHSLSSQKGNAFMSFSQTISWLLATNLMLLTWIGGSPVETPYDLIGSGLTLTYFLLFASLMILHNPPKW